MKGARNKGKESGGRRGFGLIKRLRLETLAGGKCKENKGGGGWIEHWKRNGEKATDRELRAGESLKTETRKRNSIEVSSCSPSVPRKKFAAFYQWFESVHLTKR